MLPHAAIGDLKISRTISELCSLRRFVSSLRGMAQNVIRSENKYFVMVDKVDEKEFSEQA